MHILSSPYHNIRKREKGLFISIINYCEHPPILPEIPICCRNEDEVWRIEFQDGRSSLFRPYEVAYV